jgi:hypothetical protein
MIRIPVSVCTTLLILACGLPILAQQPATNAASVIVPSLVKFTSALSDGKPLAGVIGVTFSLYKDSHGGAPLWMEIQNVRPDKNGHYTVLLGASKSDGFPTELFTSGEARWLGVQVQGSEEQPRILLVTVPYATKAHEAETLAGKSASDFVLSNQLSEQVHEILTAGLRSTNRTGLNSGNPAAAQGPTNFSGSTSDQIVSVIQGGTGNGLVATVPSNSGSTAAIRGTATNTTGKGRGVVGSSFSNKDGIGVVGSVGTLGAPGNGIGVEGQALNLGGIGVSGGGLVGVQGLSSIPSGSGVQGLFSGTSGGGVVGINHPTGSLPVPTGNFGVYGQAAGSTGQGIFGESFGTGVDSNGGSDGVHGIAHSANGSGVAGANTAEGGPGLFGAGGGGSSVNGFGGQGVRGFGGSETQGSGGTGVVATGGNGVLGGFGVIAGGGNGGIGGHGGVGVTAGGGSSTQNGSGGNGIDVTGGSGDPLTGHGGIGVLALGGSGHFGGDGIDVSRGEGLESRAGVFHGPVQVDGDLNVSGSFSAGHKDFKIDHPLDPANKYLYHASVESSEMLNIYTHNVILDGNGEAVIQLPEWFGAENADFRYQLTAIGGAAPNLHVAEEVANSQFKIAGGAPGMKVSWQVSAVRQDAYAKAHSLQVEEQKPKEERGFYIHPDLYGAPPEKSIEWARHPQLMKRLEEKRLKGVD